MHKLGVKLLQASLTVVRGTEREEKTEAPPGVKSAPLISQNFMTFLSQKSATKLLPGTDIMKSNRSMKRRHIQLYALKKLLLS